MRRGEKTKPKRSARWKRGGKEGERAGEKREDQEKRQWMDWCRTGDANGQIRVSLSSMNEASVCLGTNRSRSNELSCAVVVLTLTAVETQLTKGFSLSPAATARHSDVASGKAVDFPCGPRDEHEGWRASMLPTTTASSSSAATSSPRTGGGSAAPAVLQKLGHPNAPSQRRQYGSALHADTYAPLLPPSVHCLHVSVCPRIWVFIPSVLLSA